MKAYAVVFEEATRITLDEWKKDYKKGTKLLLDRATALYAAKNGARMLGEVEIEFKDVEAKLKSNKKPSDDVKVLKAQAKSLGLWKDFEELDEEGMRKAIEEAKATQTTLIEEAKTLWLEVDDSQSIPEITKAIEEAKAK